MTLQYNFHLSERTMLRLIADPLFPNDPSNMDIRAGLLRLLAADTEVEKIEPKIGRQRIVNQKAK